MNKLAYNLILILSLYIFWLSTQKFFETDIYTKDKIIDRLHNTELLNYFHNYLKHNYEFTRFLFILTTLMIDINTLYFVFKFLFFGKHRPIYLLIGGVVLRQLCQYMTRLPEPDGMVWFDPIFPTLLMNYDVSSDFQWSGHTYISVLFGIELLKSHNRLVKFYALFHVILEISFVLVTKGHYFMDVYGAIASYFMLVYLYEKFFKKLNFKVNTHNTY